MDTWRPRYGPLTDAEETTKIQTQQNWIKLIPRDSSWFVDINGTKDEAQKLILRVGRPKIWSSGPKNWSNVRLQLTRQDVCDPPGLEINHFFSFFFRQKFIIFYALSLDTNFISWNEVWIFCFWGSSRGLPTRFDGLFGLWKLYTVIFDHNNSDGMSHFVRRMIFKKSEIRFDMVADWTICLHQFRFRLLV